METSTISEIWFYNSSQHSLLNEDEIWSVICKTDLITDEWELEFQSFLCSSHNTIDFTKTSNSTELLTEELSLLGWASRNGHRAIAALIIEYAPLFQDIINQQMTEGITPLGLACEEGHDEIVTLLLDSGADLNYLTLSDYTPLYLATFHGHISAVQAILEHPRFKGDPSSDVDAPCGAYGGSALHMACEKGHAEIATLLLNTGAKLDFLDGEGYRPFDLAVLYNKLNVVQAFLQHPRFKDDPSSDVDDPDCTYGGSALHIACEKGHAEIATLLLNTGAKLDFLDDEGYRPFGLAVLYNKLNVVQAFLQHPSFKNDSSQLDAFNGPDEETALHIACEQGHAEIVTLLLNTGAKLDFLDDAGYRSFGLAVLYNKLNVVQAFLQHPRFKNDSSQLDASNGPDKETALHIACEQGHAKIVTLLLDAGASLFCKTKDGQSAFDIAQRHPHLPHVIFSHLTGGEGNVESFVSKLDQKLVSLKKRMKNQEPIDLAQLFKSIQLASGVCLASTMPQQPLIAPSLARSLKKLLKQDQFYSTLQSQVQHLESSIDKTDPNLEKIIQDVLPVKNYLTSLQKVFNQQLSNHLINNQLQIDALKNKINHLTHQLNNIQQKAQSILAASKLQTLVGFQSQFNGTDVFILLTEWNIGVAHVATSNQIASSSAASSQDTAVVNLNPMESIANHLGIGSGKDLWACGLMEGQDLRAIGIDLDIKYYCEQWPHRRTDSDCIAEMTGLLKNKTLLWDAILGVNHTSSVAAFITQLESGTEELDVPSLIQAYKNNSLSLLIAFLSKKNTIKKNLNTNFKNLSLSEISIQTTWIPLELYQHLTAKQTDNPSKRQKH